MASACWHGVGLFPTCRLPKTVAVMEPDRQDEQACWGHGSSQHGHSIATVVLTDAPYQANACKSGVPSCEAINCSPTRGLMAQTRVIGRNSRASPLAPNNFCRGFTPSRLHREPHPFLSSLCNCFVPTACVSVASLPRTTRPRRQPMTNKLMITPRPAEVSDRYKQVLAMATISLLLSAVGGYLRHQTCPEA
jgi:hypothetical protein